MCLIIASPNGEQITDSQFRDAWRMNPHGCGIMRASAGRAGAVSISKYLEIAPALADYRRVAGMPHVIHWRMATHGGVTLANVHPFQLGPKLAVAHNGIIRGVTMRRGESDTRAYARILRQRGLTLADVRRHHDEIAAEIGGGSKLAFLDAAGSIEIVNASAGHWYNGQWFSNTYSCEIGPRRASRSSKKHWANSLESTLSRCCYCDRVLGMHDGLYTCWQCQDVMADDEIDMSYWAWKYDKLAAGVE